MADYNLGPYRLKPRGDYSGTTEYTYLDLVRYKGSGYVCCNEDLIDGVSCIGIPPTGNTSSELYWMCMVDAGEAASASDYEYMGFITVDDMEWDYSEGDKIIIPETTSSSDLNISDVYDGCCGLIVTKNTSINLPSNSATSADFNYVTLQTGQVYLYSFVYCDYGNGGTFLWNRTVMDE